MYIDIKLIELAGFVSALQALRLPFGLECRSHWSRSMLNNVSDHADLELRTGFKISKEDEDLLRSLIKRGDEHAKVIRGIVAYVELNAPRYMWQEFDTYRIGRETLASESTMHIQGKGLSEEELVEMKNELKEGTMQKRIIMLSYQTLRRIYKQRRKHRLPHWREFCAWIETLPYSWMITDGIDRRAETTHCRCFLRRWLLLWRV